MTTAPDDPTEAEAAELRRAYEAGSLNVPSTNGHGDKRDIRDNRPSFVTSVTFVPWETPAPLVRAVNVPAFPVEVFPEWMRDHVQAVAHFTQTPVDLAATVALAALATAMAGRVEVQIRGPWREPANLFTVTSLPPGSRKSAVFASMTKPIYLAEKVLVDKVEHTILEAETLLAVEEAKLMRAKAKAAKAEATTEREELEDEAIALADLIATMAGEMDPRPRLVADDITPEAAAALLAEQGGRLGVLSAEGGIFQILAGRYSTAPNLDLFLKGHAGDPLRVDRKSTAPLIVDNPALTLGLTVQPEVLKAISEMPGFRGRGLLARICYSLPINTVGYRKVGVEPPADEIANRYEVFLSDLARLFFEQEGPTTVALSKEAAAALLKVERDLEPQLRPDGDVGFIVDWASKLVGAIARIALLLHIATTLGTTDDPISEDTMHNAIKVGDYFIAHALAAFDFMGVDPAVEGARTVLDWVKRNQLDRFTRREAHRGCRRFKKVTELDDPLHLLEEHGYVRGADVIPDGGGPRSRTYHVNPYFHRTNVTDVTKEQPWEHRRREVDRG
jgi:replicative DNA helicase